MRHRKIIYYLAKKVFKVMTSSDIYIIVVPFFFYSALLVNACKSGLATKSKDNSPRKTYLNARNNNNDLKVNPNIEIKNAGNNKKTPLVNNQNPNEMFVICKKSIKSGDKIITIEQTTNDPRLKHLAQTNDQNQNNFNKIINESISNNNVPLIKGNSNNPEIYNKFNVQNEPHNPQNEIANIKMNNFQETKSTNSNEQNIIKNEENNNSKTNMAQDNPNLDPNIVDKKGHTKNDKTINDVKINGQEIELSLNKDDLKNNSEPVIILNIRKEDLLLHNGKTKNINLKNQTNISDPCTKSNIQNAKASIDSENNLNIEIDLDVDELALAKNNEQNNEVTKVKIADKNNTKSNELRDAIMHFNGKNGNNEDPYKILEDLLKGQNYNIVFSEPQDIHFKTINDIKKQQNVTIDPLDLLDINRISIWRPSKPDRNVVLYLHSINKENGNFCLIKWVWNPKLERWGIGNIIVSLNNE